MRELQAALKDLTDEGLYVARGAWMSTERDMNAPSQYVVYSTTTADALLYDDCVAMEEVEVYMNVWSDNDPTELLDNIKSRMYAAGFRRIGETDRGYNQPRWSHMKRQHCVYLTWMYRRHVHNELIG